MQICSVNYYSNFSMNKADLNFLEAADLDWLYCTHSIDRMQAALVAKTRRHKVYHSPHSTWLHQLIFLRRIKTLLCVRQSLLQE